MLRVAYVCAIVAVVNGLGDLPVGPFAPVVIPAAPKPNWSWERIPTSFHGAVKDREFTDAEVKRLAKYQMATIEKWYTPCASQGPMQGTPSCAVESKIEKLFGRIRAETRAMGIANQTGILYWNSMFDFSFYTAHQGMLDLEAAGKKAFLRDDTGAVISLCNDGNVYCNITTFDWTQPAVRALWVHTVTNATASGLIHGIFADHSAQEGTIIGNTKVNKQAPNQLCNGKSTGRRCYNFTDTFRDSFNSWHLWATNYTQDLLSKTTGGPVIQGPLASMNTLNTIVDPSYCDFDGIRTAQATSGQAVFEARGSCKPTETCLAAYLAAAEPGTYVHCLYNGDDLLKATTFAHMDDPLGAPNGTAQETSPGSGVWRRWFASGTAVEYNNKKKKGTINWATVPTPVTPVPVPPSPSPACPSAQPDCFYKDHDLAATVARSWTDCCADCAGHKGCSKWVWTPPTKCHLHDSKATKKSGDVGGNFCGEL
jgi:hypothetical protein